MKNLTSALALAAAAVCTFSTWALAGSARPVVVELFTSQGCADCPPADAFMGKLVQQPDVIAITLPITYWDMLGWRDTLARDENTRRQKAYARAMGRGGIYTPQIIVDGVTDVVGSRTGSVEVAIAARQAAIDAATGVAPVSVSSREPGTFAKPATSDPVVPVSVRETPQEMHITIGGADDGRDVNATVWMFHLRAQISVAIAAGENAGHTLTYHNVAADLKPVGVWKGKSVALTLPRATMADLPHDGVAILVQQGGYGHVLGAAYLARPDYSASR